MNKAPEKAMFTEAAIKAPRETRIVDYRLGKPITRGVIEGPTKPIGLSRPRSGWQRFLIANIVVVSLAVAVGLWRRRVKSR